MPSPTSSIDKNHHAYLLVGERGAATDWLVPKIEKDFGLSSNGNPDFILWSFEDFGIKEAREVTDWSLLKPSGAGLKVLVLSLRGITPEAQNALLKTLEEPPLGTYIFLVLNSTGRLLPTLLSRVVTLGLTKSSVAKGGFLSLSIPERLRLLRPILDAEDGRDGAMKFLEELQLDIGSKLRHKPGEALARFAKSVLLSAQYASKPGASLKYILETLAITLPRF